MPQVDTASKTIIIIYISYYTLIGSSKLLLKKNITYKGEYIDGIEVSIYIVG